MNSQDTIKTTSKITKSFGTADRVVINGTHVDLIDFKFGRNPVDDADINIQGQAYLLGVMDKFPDMETATVHFLLPRRDEVLKHDYTREDMDTIRLRVKLVVERATTEAVALNPNTEGCRFCKHRISCPALTDKLLPLAKNYLAESEDFELDFLEKYDPAKVDDPFTISKMKNVAQVLDKWTSAVGKQALKLAAEEGEDIPGYGLYFRKTAQSVPVADAVDALSEIMDEQEIMEACNTSVRVLGKIAYDKADKGDKAKARAEVEATLMKKGVIMDSDEVPQTPYLRKNKK